MQSLEPAGVCARNLSECLMLQIQRLNIENDVLNSIVENYLALVGKNQLQLIKLKKLRLRLRR